MIIAIDGPAGAGKSTISRLLAQRLGFVRIDTGALYRAVALAALRAGVAPTDGARLADLVSGLDLTLTISGIRLGDEDVSTAIRAPEIGLAASTYAAVPAVRAGLMDLQRRLGRSHDSVMDGRDIGTVVFPDADAKIYLTASAEARAGRRHRELMTDGHPADFDVVLREIRQRDHQDTTRAIAPLRQAGDATVIDATDLDIEGAVSACLQVVEAIRERRAQK